MWVTANWLRVACLPPSCQLIRQLYIRPAVHGKLYIQAVLLIGSCTYRQLYIYAVDTTGICIYNQLSIKAVVHTGSCTYMQLYIQAVVHTGSCAAVHTSRFIKANSGCIQRRRLFTASYTHIMKIVGSWC